MNRSLLALLLLPAVALAAPVPKAKDNSKLYFCVEGRMTRVNPDGSDLTVLFDDTHNGFCGDLSPDGKRMLSVRDIPDQRETSVEWREEGGEPQVLLTSKKDGRAAWWARNGKTVYCYEGRDDTLLTVDVATKDKTAIRIPKEYQCTGRLTAGGELVFEKFRDEKGNFILSSATSPANEFKPTEFISPDVGAYSVAAFPDGKRWVVRPFGRQRTGLGVYTVGEKAAVWWGKNKPEAHVAAVRPDGNRVAYVRMIVPEGKKKMAYELWTADPDGENAIKVTEAHNYIFPLYWR